MMSAEFNGKPSAESLRLRPTDLIESSPSDRRDVSGVTKAASMQRNREATSRIFAASKRLVLCTNGATASYGSTQVYEIVKHTFNFCDGYSGPYSVPALVPYLHMEILVNAIPLVARV